MNEPSDERFGQLEALLRTVGDRLKATPISGVRAKGVLDVVSDLDVWAEQEVTSFLSRFFPGDSVLSEESSSSAAFAERLWVLDPLDGTVNCASGVPFFAISLALLEHGYPTVAYVYDPNHDELFSARRGQGARLNGTRLAPAPGQAHGVALTSELLRHLASRAPAELHDLLSHHGRLRNLGAQALHLCYVAAGRLSAAASLETRLWDNAAGALIAMEAGAIVTDLFGGASFPVRAGDSPLRGAAQSCIAGTALQHQRLTQLFQRVPLPYS